MTRILPIEDPSIGFDPTTGETVELRFTVSIRETNEFSLLRIRGAQNVRNALASIEARSIEDVRHAQAVVSTTRGVMMFVSLVPGTKPTRSAVYRLIANPPEPSAALRALAGGEDARDLDIEALESAEA